MGTKLFVSVCRSTSVAPLTPTYHIWSPTGDKPWYLTEGNLLLRYITPSTWGLPTKGEKPSSEFLAPLPGTPSAKIGELHTTLYLCFLVLLVYLLVFLSYMKNQKTSCYLLPLSCFS